MTQLSPLHFDPLLDVTSCFGASCVAWELPCTALSGVEIAASCLVSGPSSTELATAMITAIV
eukprot:5109507-Amphidinium_carterae.1